MKGRVGRWDKGTVVGGEGEAGVGRREGGAEEEEEESVDRVGEEEEEGKVKKEGGGLDSSRVGVGCYLLSCVRGTCTLSPSSTSVSDCRCPTTVALMFLGCDWYNHSALPLSLRGLQQPYTCRQRSGG